jgi:hypothetical protein
VPNGRDANRFAAVGQLVEDPISPDPQRVEAAQFPSKRISAEWVALKHCKGILDRVDQRPVKLE